MPASQPWAGLDHAVPLCRFKQRSAPNSFMHEAFMRREDDVSKIGETSRRAECACALRVGVALYII